MESKFNQALEERMKRTDDAIFASFGLPEEAFGRPIEPVWKSLGKRFLEVKRDEPWD